MADKSPKAPDVAPEVAADAATPAADTATATDEVTAKLLEHGVDQTVIDNIKDTLGVTDVAGLALLNEADLVMAGMKAIPARQLLGAFTPETTPTAVDATIAYDVLPAIPEDGSWLDSLRAGGVLKVDTSTVIAAIRVALASRVGLYDIPDKLVAEMERFAETNDDPVDASYFELRNQVTRRNYGDIFSAIPGLDGNYVTAGRKKELLARIEANLWPAVSSYIAQLDAWYTGWVQGASNPALLFSALAGARGGFALPPGMMQAPDAGALRDAGDSLNDAANKVFAGTGAQIAAAMAYDALQIKKQLEDTRLPALIGAANREQMLKQLGVAVNASYPRLERDLTRFVLAALQAKDQSAGTEEQAYFGAMYLLGTQLPLKELHIGGTSGLSGIGGPTGRL